MNFKQRIDIEIITLESRHQNKELQCRHLLNLTDPVLKNLKKNKNIMNKEIIL
jgi:hypothetical protein